ncbi:MAG: hypothetical protein KC505_06290 [Myxococcales bacterium]|nr:hypothetical protein [Myxococcales bacterium]USN50678.1 MAG: hypothetical protein H6731_10515 [Myxococcales bacterium]
MNTNEQLSLIAEICQHDLKMAEVRKNLARLNKDSDQAKKNAQELEAAINSMTGTRDGAMKQRKALDEKLQLEKSNLRKWEARAEKIKGEREYTALMSEISSQKRTISGVEAEMAELASEIKASEEKMNKATGAHEENVERAKHAFEEVKELLFDEEKHLETVAQAKEKLLEKLPSTIKTRYERIYKSRMQQGIAFVRNEVCQACQRTIPAELYIKVCKGEVIEQCPSCQRILVSDFALEN